jgi:hypothetical protein
VVPDLQTSALKALVADGVSCPTDRAVIVVIGAGASLDCVKLPVADETARIVTQRLGVRQDYVDGELSRLSRQFRLDATEFETQMLALGKFEPHALRDALVSIFGRRFYVAECYEILAHLLKHRFIDTIINFNFDEILDQAIGDELEEGNYWRVVSDGDLPGSSMRDLHARLRRPLYIKPHGTVSHASSLRFTREAYLLIPESINALISECLTSTPVTLVTVGFRMRSVEFQAIVDDALTKGAADIEVIAIDPSPDVLSAFQKIPEPKLHHYNPLPDGLARTFERLWEEVGCCFAKKDFTRGIQRHRLLAALFQDKPNRDVPEAERGIKLTNYLRDRALVELALAVAKAKGFVHVGQLAGSRAGRYLREYRNAKSSRRTIYKLCEMLAMHPVGYSHDTLRLLPPSRNGGDPQRLIVDPDEWDQEGRQRLVDALGTSLEDNSRQRTWARSTAGQQMLNDVLDALYHGEEVEVISSRSSRRTLLFESPEELSSFAATRIYTRQLLQSHWDQLWCVAETGDWLGKDDVVEAAAARGNRSIAVIVADEARKRHLEEKYRTAGVKIWVVTLPWWLHNQHMTLAVRRTPQRALFFERRLRSLAINPVGLERPADLNVIRETFLAYWAKASQRTPGSSFVRPEDLADAESRLHDIGNWPQPARDQSS